MASFMELGMELVCRTYGCFHKIKMLRWIQLNRGLGRYAVICSNTLERVTLMSTYEEFMVILTFALLVVAILDYKK